MTTILNDNQIAHLAQNGMISPFVPQVTRVIDGKKIISYGCGSYGYDIRLSPKQFKIFNHIPGEVVDPKNFNPKFLKDSELHSDEHGQYFILPAHSYGLGVAMERLEMAPNVTAICIGKSTYARAGIIANLTPVEAGWTGHLTIEISNSSSADCRIYAGEGIAQLLFLQGDDCNVTYQDRQGKYQDQPESVVFSKV